MHRTDAIIQSEPRDNPKKYISAQWVDLLNANEHANGKDINTKTQRNE